MKRAKNKTQGFLMEYYKAEKNRSLAEWGYGWRNSFTERKYTEELQEATARADRARADILQALEILPDRQREILAARYINLDRGNFRKWQQIADALGLHEKYVESLHKEALDTLQRAGYGAE